MLRNFDSYSTELRLSQMSGGGGREQLKQSASRILQEAITTPRLSEEDAKKTSLLLYLAQIFEVAGRFPAKEKGKK